MHMVKTNGAIGYPVNSHQDNRRLTLLVGWIVQLRAATIVTSLVITYTRLQCQHFCLRVKRLRSLPSKL